MNNAVTDSLAAEIRSIHQLITASLKRTVDNALRVGQLLTQAKGQMNHGEWIPWVTNNCGFSDRSAARYMKLHRHRQLIVGHVADLTDAYRIVGEIETSDVQISRKVSVPPRPETGWKATVHKAMVGDDGVRRHIRRHMARRPSKADALVAIQELTEWLSTLARGIAGEEE